MIVLLAIVVSWAFVYWIRCLMWKTPMDPPVLSNHLPIIGHTHLLLYSAERLTLKFLEFSMEALMKGGVAMSTFGLNAFYIVSDPEDGLTVLNSCLDKDPRVYKFWKPWLGEGLITGTVKIWQKLRKLYLPSFSPRNLNKFVGIVNQQGTSLVNYLDTKAGKGSFDMTEYLSVIALQNSLLTSVGLNAKHNDDIIYDKINKYTQAIDDNDNIIKLKTRTFSGHFDWLYKYTTLYKEEERVLTILRDLSCELIERRRMENNNTAEDKSLKYRLFIDIFLELKEQGVLNQEQLETEVNSLIFGGQQTIVLTLLTVSIMIGSYPEVQDRIYKEIRNVCGDPNSEVKTEDLGKMIYLDATIKETMRLHTFLPLIPRMIKKDTKLKNHTLKANSICFVSIYGIHRHPVWGPDPEVFRPERWLEPEVQTAATIAFGGFSMGKRSCFGKTYALMNMKTTLIHMIRRYRLIADHSKLQFSDALELKPTAGHFISVEKRE